jgi:hypothetical protein
MSPGKNVIKDYRKTLVFARILCPSSAVLGVDSILEVV